MPGVAIYSHVHVALPCVNLIKSRYLTQEFKFFFPFVDKILVGAITSWVVSYLDPNVRNDDSVRDVIL